MLHYHARYFPGPGGPAPPLSHGESPPSPLPDVHHAGPWVEAHGHARPYSYGHLVYKAPQSPPLRPLDGDGHGPRHGPHHAPSYGRPDDMFAGYSSGPHCHRVRPQIDFEGHHSPKMMWSHGGRGGDSRRHRGHHHGRLHVHGMCFDPWCDRNASHHTEGKRRPGGHHQFRGRQGGCGHSRRHGPPPPSPFAASRSSVPSACPSPPHHVHDRPRTRERSALHSSSIESFTSAGLTSDSESIISTRYVIDSDGAEKVHEHRNGLKHHHARGTNSSSSESDSSSGSSTTSSDDDERSQGKQLHDNRHGSPHHGPPHHHGAFHQGPFLGPHGRHADWYGHHGKRLADKRAKKAERHVSKHAHKAERRHASEQYKS